MVFVNSVSDLFHEDVDFAWIHEIRRVIENHPQHIFLSLTKRADRMQQYFSMPLAPILPSPNWWIGVSVENQYFADIRLPLLRAIPAAVRWVSVEPLLGHINFEEHFQRYDLRGRNVTGVSGLFSEDDRTGIDWAVFGGESGAGARPMHPAWLYSGIKQADDAGIPVFFKQWGQHRPALPADVGTRNKIKIVAFKRGPVDPGDPIAMPMVRVKGKAQAGATLEPDGYFPFERREYPQTKVMA